MSDEAKESPPPSPSDETPPAAAPQPPGAGAIDPAAALADRIAAASAGATAEYLEQQPGKKSGSKARGGDTKPRQLPPQCRPGYRKKPVPLGDVGAAAPAASVVDEGIPTPLGGWGAAPADVVADLDQKARQQSREKTAEAGVKFGLRMFNKVCEAIARGVTQSCTGDPGAADAAAKAARMDGEYEELMRESGVEYVKSSALNLQKLPGVMFFGGLLVHAGSVAINCKAIADGKVTPIQTPGGAQ